jgi:NADH-quinone oxidoreductase subunit H
VIGVAEWGLALLIWPGLLGGALLSWLFLWLARKLTAVLQGRQGPPFYQPFFDFGKLLGKRAVVPAGVRRAVVHGLPLVSAASITVALSLLPVPGNPVRSFPGDLVLLVYLLEVPAVCTVLAGYGSRSAYGRVGAGREAILWLGASIPFLGALIALAAHTRSFQLSVLAAAPLGPVHAAAGAAFLLAVPARLRRNPFSIPNAEQEIVAGALTEYSGPPLALFELAHGLELTALVGLLAVLLVPPSLGRLAGWLLYLGVGGLLVGLISVVGAATARLTLPQALRFYWRWGAMAAGLALVAAAML